MKQEQPRQFLRIRSALTFIEVCYNPIQVKRLWGQTHRPVEQTWKPTLYNIQKQIPIQRTEHEKKNKHLEENIEHLYDLGGKKEFLKI